MLTAKFYKIANCWYLDNPEFLEKGGNPEDLECIGGMHDLLEYVSDDQSFVTLLLGFEPFEAADEGVLVATSGGNTGAYYQVHTLNGQVVDLEIWVDGIFFLQYPELPLRIYGKPIT